MNIFPLDLKVHNLYVKVFNSIIRQSINNIWKKKKKNYFRFSASGKSHKIQTSGIGQIKDYQFYVASTLLKESKPGKTR